MIFLFHTLVGRIPHCDFLCRSSQHRPTLCDPLVFVLQRPQTLIKSPYQPARGWKHNLPLFSPKSSKVYLFGIFRGCYKTVQCWCIQSQAECSPKGSRGSCVAGDPGTCGWLSSPANKVCSGGGCLPGVRQQGNHLGSGWDPLFSAHVHSKDFKGLRWCTYRKILQSTSTLKVS